MQGRSGALSAFVDKTFAWQIDREGDRARLVRLSLGGVRAEAEIRDRRRTHFGSMPGAVTQSIRKAKSSSPLAFWTRANQMGADFEHHVGRS